MNNRNYQSTQGPREINETTISDNLISNGDNGDQNTMVRDFTDQVNTRTPNIRDIM